MKKILHKILIVIFYILNRLYNSIKNPHAKSKNKSYKKIAFQIHVFYVDIFPEIISYLQKFDFDYDLFISTNEEEKKEEITKIINENLNTNIKYQIDIVPNIGRDIYPFLYQMNNKYNNYDIICHLHTKKSKLVDWGDCWRKDIYKKLLLNANDHFNILSEDNNIGLISPSPYKKITLLKLYINNLLKKENYVSVLNTLKQLDNNIFISRKAFYFTQYPCGNMFIAKTDAIKQLFIRAFNINDFPEELGQTENTLQHTVEFIWEPLINNNNYKYLEV